MIPLSDTIKRIAPSPTLAASQRANELIAAGRDIISFTVGEPDFDTPVHVKEAAKKALDQGKTKYTAVAGIPELKKAIQAKFKRDQGVEYGLNQIIVTNGGKQALAALFSVILNPGDEVIIPAPYWTSYPDMALLAGGTPVIVETTSEAGYILSPEQLKNAINAKTRILVINSPSNPTGACYTQAQLMALAEVIEASPYRDNICIVSDEVYEYITYDGYEHASIVSVAPNLKDNIVIVNAYSKAYAMTGWRVGYAAGPAHIISAINNHQSQFTSGICSIAQYAAAAAYTDDCAFPQKMKEEFTRRMDIVARWVAETKGVEMNPKPLGAFYAFLDVRALLGKKHGDVTVKTSEDLAALLMEQYDVVAVPGEAFGAPATLRLSFAMDTAQLQKGLERIGRAASALLA